MTPHGSRHVNSCSVGGPVGLSNQISRTPTRVSPDGVPPKHKSIYRTAILRGTFFNVVNVTTLVANATSIMSIREYVSATNLMTKVSPRLGWYRTISVHSVTRYDGSRLPSFLWTKTSCFEQLALLCENQARLREPRGDITPVWKRPASKRESIQRVAKRRSAAYTIIPVSTNVSVSGVTSFPFLSRTRSRFAAHSTVAIVMKRESLARCFPTQERLPKP